MEQTTLDTQLASLADGLLTSDVIDSYRASVELELNDAVEFAESSPSPLPEECLADVYVE